MGSTRFRNPLALSSALTVAQAPQPKAFGFLNCVDPLVSMPNYYLVFTFDPTGKGTIERLAPSAMRYICITEPRRVGILAVDVV